MTKMCFSYLLIKKYFHGSGKVQLEVQVSLAIRGGYVPDKFRTANTKTGSLGLN